MKAKILLPIAILFFATTTVNAQINEGRYLLGGSVSYNSSKAQQAPNLNLNLFISNIQFGKVIKGNTVAGIIVSYGYSNSGPTNKTNQFSGGVFYRKYKTLAKKFYFFGEGDAIYSHSTSTQGQFEIGSNGNKYFTNGGTLSFTPGISYSVCKRMQMELLMPNLVSLSYTGMKTETTNTGITSMSIAKNHTFSANANLNTNILNSFGIGFKFFFRKIKKYISKGFLIKPF